MPLRDRTTARAAGACRRCRPGRGCCHSRGRKGCSESGEAWRHWRRGRPTGGNEEGDKLEQELTDYLLPSRGTSRVRGSSRHRGLRLARASGSGGGTRGGRRGGMGLGQFQNCGGQVCRHSWRFPFEQTSSQGTKTEPKAPPNRNHHARGCSVQLRRRAPMNGLPLRCTDQFGAVSEDQSSGKAGAPIVNNDPGQFNRVLIPV